MNLAKTKALFKKAYYYNWDNGLQGLQAILDDAHCDKATALHIFWAGAPSFFYHFEANFTRKMQPYEQQQHRFLLQLEKRLLQDFFPSLIAYEVAPPLRPESLGNIPARLLEPSTGSVDYQTVLHPKQPPFEQEIVALCQACDDSKQLFDLAEKGADFSQKILKGMAYPLSIAVAWGNVEALIFFAKKEFDFNQKYDKAPLFWKAVYNKQMPALIFLLKQGINLNAKGLGGRSILHDLALHFAHFPSELDQEMKDLIAFLIASGLDTKALNAQKKTALDLAKMANLEAWFGSEELD